MNNNHPLVLVSRTACRFQNPLLLKSLSGPSVYVGSTSADMEGQLCYEHCLPLPPTPQTEGIISGWNCRIAIVIGRVSLLLI